MAGPLLIRSALPTDADALAQVHALSWRETYTDEVPEQVYQRIEQQGPARWRERLVEPGGSATWVGVERATGDLAALALVEAVGPGEVRPVRLSALYVLERWHGQGLGRALLQHALGDAPAYLWVAESNLRAQRFYERNGFELDGERRVEARWGGLADLRMVR